MAQKLDWTDPSKFSIARLESDINNYCKKERMTVEMISTDVLVRTPRYLGDCLRKKTITWNIFKFMANYLGYDLDRYKIAQPKPVQKEEPKPEPVEADGNWSIKLLVNEDFGVVRCMLNHGMETIATGSCDSDLNSGADIIKAITVAVNRMNSKLIPGQQSPYVEKKAEEPKPEPPKPDGKVGRKTFKEWVMQYYDSHSDAGRLARFIDEHYEAFPSWGQVKMQRFLELTQGGKAHRVTFDAYFDHYRKLTQAEERANSESLRK